MLVLGLESSCDETACGIVSDSGAGLARLRAHVVASQIEAHRPYGGVVPEVAARAHFDVIDGVTRQALEQAGVGIEAVDAFAATCGPGLIGGVMVGAMMGKALAAATGKPFIAVNHLEAHALAARLSDEVAFPYLLLLVSGGHCQILLTQGIGRYRRLGGTLDDAVGECFDKSAKLLGLGYPGGAAIEAAARRGEEAAFSLPRPMVGRSGCDFSFSGLKTAVRLAVQAAPQPLSDVFVADMAAAVQAAIVDILIDRTRRAFFLLEEEGVRPASFVVGGGVAANGAVRGALGALAEERGARFVAPPISLCTDNGAMIAWAGLERLSLGLVDGLDFRCRPRWPLEEMERNTG